MQEKKSLPKFNFHRTLGSDEDGNEITATRGKFGPFVTVNWAAPSCDNAGGVTKKVGNTKIQIPIKSPLAYETITLNQVLSLFDEKDNKDKKN